MEYNKLFALFNELELDCLEGYEVTPTGLDKTIKLIVGQHEKVEGRNHATTIFKFDSTGKFKNVIIEDGF